MEFQQLLQNLQDTYADQLKLTLLITDSNGKAITSISNLTPLIQTVIDSVKSSFKEKWQEHRAFFQERKRPFLIDSNLFSPFTGLKIIVSPIEVEGGQSYFIWGGVFIEEGFKEFVQKQFDDKLNLEEFSYIEVEVKRHQLEKLTFICDELLKGRQIEHTLNRQLMMMSSLLEMSKTMQLAEEKDELLSMLAHMALQLVPGRFCITSLLSGELVHRFNHHYLHPNNITTFHHEQMRTNYSNRTFTEPLLTETEWGTVLTFPLFTRQVLQGGFSVHIENLSAIKEAEVYLAHLADIGAKRLHLFDLEISRELPATVKSSILELLTARELEVLQYLVKGLTNREIAEHLYISAHTVKNHITNIFQKLGVSDRTHLIAMVYRLNDLEKV